MKLGPYNVRVNAIAPNLVNTEFSGSDAAYRVLQAQQNPMRCIAEVDDLVGAAIFLGCDASSYINGHILVVDGSSLA